MGRSRWLQRLAVAALLAATALLALGAAWLGYELDRPLQVDTPPQYLEIEQGASLQGVIGELRGRGWLSAAGALSARLYGHLSGIAGSLRTGEYAVEAEMSARRLLRRIAAGEVVQHQLTIIEGWTFERLRRALREHEAVTYTLEGVETDAVMAELGLDGEHPEGRFFPTTYNFPRGTEDRRILRLAYRKMEEHLAAAWAERQPDLPLSEPYEALILASIIEREAARPEDRREVAGVFTRRLERGMRLQSDPAVIYGLGDDHDGRLRRDDLRRDGPYNTYERRGLPPTPIALPGEASLEAAVDPAPGEALYFVARGDGTLQFSATLEEHRAAVRRYILEEQ